jgi:hypothetical protein
MPANPFGRTLRRLRALVAPEGDSDAALLACFVQARDESAFAALVRRAGSLRKREALAGFLHGVALRLARGPPRTPGARKRTDETTCPRLFCRPGPPSRKRLTGRIAGGAPHAGSPQGGLQ